MVIGEESVKCIFTCTERIQTFKHTPINREIESWHMCSWGMIDFISKLKSSASLKARKRFISLFYQVINLLTSGIITSKSLWQSYLLLRSQKAEMRLYLDPHVWISFLLRVYISMNLFILFYSVYTAIRCFRPVMKLKTVIR